MDKQPEYFIFDLDGTLFDTSLDLARSVNFALQTFEQPAHPVEDVVAFIGNGSLNLIRRSLRAEQEYLLPEIHQAFLSHYLENCTMDTRPYQGVMEFLQQNIRASVLTNKPYAPTVRILKHFGLESRFDHVLCGDTAPERKPQPGGLLSILQQVGVQPELALMVGDDLPDIGVALAAGVPSLAILSGFGRAPELRTANPTYIVPDFLSFVQLVHP